MHAVLMTFQSAASLDDVHDDFLTGASAISEVPGLLSKTWLQEGERLGGFYIFTDASAAEAYLDGPIISQTKTVPAFSDFEVRHFALLEEFSAITRGIPAQTPAAAD